VARVRVVCPLLKKKEFCINGLCLGDQLVVHVCGLCSGNLLVVRACGL
jgi:hypothetical protein